MLSRPTRVRLRCPERQDKKHISCLESVESHLGLHMLALKATVPLRLCEYDCIISERSLTCCT
jgi:hypothetical protein